MEEICLLGIQMYTMMLLLSLRPTCVLEVRVYIYQDRDTLPLVDLWLIYFVLRIRP